MDQLGLIDIIGYFTTKQCISPLSKVHTELSPGSIISWAINLALVNSKKKKMKAFQAYFLSDHNAVKFDVNYRKKNIKNMNIWR